jgi:hypothetical protein
MPANPFDLLDPEPGTQQPAVKAAPKVANPFDALDPEPGTPPTAPIATPNAPYSPVHLTSGAIAALPLADQLKRSGGLAARALATGWASTPMMVADAVNGLANIAGKQNNPPTSQQFQQLLTQWGLPTADTTGEKIGQFGAQLVAGASEPAMRALQLGAAAFGPKQPFPSTVPNTNEFGTPLLDKVRADTIKQATDLGYLSTPSISGAGLKARGVETFANKGMIEQGAMKKNQIVTDQLSRQIAGLGKDMPIEPETVQNAISQVWEKGYKPIEDLARIPVTPNGPYQTALANIYKETQGTVPNQAIAKLLNQYDVASFTGKNAIKDIRLLRDDANKLWQSDDVGSEPLAMAHTMLANAIEDNIQSHLSSIGQNGAEMLAAFKNARTTMAQQYTIKNAIVKGTGSVNAAKIGAQFQKDAPFTGDLAVMAKFANAAPQLIKSPSASAPTMFSNMERASGMFGIGAAGHGNFIPAALALSYPALAIGARTALKSPFGQRMIAPNLNPGIGSSALQSPYVQNALPTAFKLGSGLFGQ